MLFTKFTSNIIIVNIYKIMFIYLFFCFVFGFTCVCVVEPRFSSSPFRVLDGHDGFGVGRGRGGRRFGDRRGRRVQLLLLVVMVQMVLVGRGRLEHDPGAAAEGARMIGRGRGILVERSVQLLVARVTGGQRRYGDGGRPSVT